VKGPLSLLGVLALGGLFLAGLAHTVIQGLSPEAWARLATASFARTGLFTLWYAGASALLAGILGTFLALALPHGEHSLHAASRLWLVLPPTSVAFLVILVLAPTGIVATIVSPGATWAGSPVRDELGLGMITAAVIKETAFATLWVRSVLSSLDPRLVQTARMLGASRLQIFREVVGPVVWPASVTASLMVFVYALGSWEIPWMLGPSTPQTLSIMVYNAREHGDAGDRAAAAAVLTLLAAVSALAAWLVPGRKGRNGAAPNPEVLP